MTLYKGNSKIKDRGSFGVYAGSQPIKKIYHGSTLVYEYESYDPDEVVLDITNSTQTITLKRGVYDLCVTGGGGNLGKAVIVIAGNPVGTANGGGSGATFEGTFYNPSDVSATFKAGGNAEDSTITIGGTVVLTAHHGVSAPNSTGDGGAGGAIPTISESFEVLTTRKKVAGNHGLAWKIGKDQDGGDTTSTYKWGEGATVHTTGAVQVGGIRLQYLRFDK